MTSRSIRHAGARHWRSVVRIADGHPVLTVVLVALVVRAIAALVIAVGHDGYFVPDEGNYVGLAGTVASGHSADSWFPSYGQQLYRTTWPFTATLAFLFRAFGRHRWLGQALAATFGAVTAGATTRLALEFTRARSAVAAGLVVALLPSGVVWSSIVLRESMVWSTVVLTALAFALSLRVRGPWAAIGCLVLAAVNMLALGHLRQQTLLVVAWVLVATAVVVPGRGRALRVMGAVALFCVVPFLSDIGIGGWTLIERSVPALARTRATMSLDSNTGIVPTTVLRPTTTAGPSVSGNTIPGEVIRGNGGTAILVNEAPSASVRYFPKGIVAVTLRPFLWERETSGSMAMAKFENLGWALLYVFAGIGAWRARRVHALWFPGLCLLAIVMVAAVTQGNLGTAFRHRSQLIWELALFAVIGAEALFKPRSWQADTVGEATAAPVLEA
jgi:hypothetical protein